jgi:hypothetical protein
MQRKQIYFMAQDMPWEEIRVSTQPIFIHIWGTEQTRGTDLNKQRIRNRGQKICIDKQIQSHV